jgi:hypothetical protein
MFCKNEFDSLNKIQDDRLSAKGIATYLNWKILNKIFVKFHMIWIEKNQN